MGGLIFIREEHSGSLLCQNHRAKRSGADQVCLPAILYQVAPCDHSDFSTVRRNDPVPTECIHLALLSASLCSAFSLAWEDHASTI